MFSHKCEICHVLAVILAIPTALWFIIYGCKSFLLLYDVLPILILFLVTNLYMHLMGPVDLKKKYKGAEWALVTGAGSGIGKALAETLAKQGLNVVLVSLPDKLLEETTKELTQKYPKQKFRTVPAKFDHKTDYMPGIIEVNLFSVRLSLLIRVSSY
jgi:hypothetical protein